MEKIENPSQLIEFKNTISTINAGLDNGRSFFNGGYKRLKKAADSNNTLYADLPAEMPVTPEIALILAKDDLSYSAKINTLVRDSGIPLKMGSTAVKSIYALLFPDTKSVHSATKSWAKLVNSIVDHEESLKKFSEERDAIASTVLGVYKLVEKDSGKYVLIRGSWNVDEQMVHDSNVSYIAHELRFYPRGVKQDFNMAKLEENVLKDIQKNRGRS